MADRTVLVTAHTGKQTALRAARRVTERLIAADIAEHAFSALKAPLRQVTALDATVPYSEPMEAYILPDEPKIIEAVHQVLGTAPVAA